MKSFTIADCKLTQKQKANLKKLAIGILGEFNVNFSMQDFATRFNARFYGDTEYITPLKVNNECGTNCCLLGHGPLIGIKPNAGEGWGSYAKRNFIGEALDSQLFDWLFDQNWPNSREECAARINYLLEGKTIEFPIDFDIRLV